MCHLRYELLVLSASGKLENVSNHDKTLFLEWDDIVGGEVGGLDLGNACGLEGSYACMLFG